MPRQSISACMWSTDKPIWLRHGPGEAAADIQLRAKRHLLGARPAVALRRPAHLGECLTCPPPDEQRAGRAVCRIEHCGAR